MSPMDSKLGNFVYLIDKVWNISRIVVINRDMHHIKIVVAPAYTPRKNPILETMDGTLLPFEDDFEHNNRIDTGFSVINICPGHKLLFPLHFQKANSLGPKLTHLRPATENCYSDSTGFEIIWPRLITHYGAFRNIAVLTVFCSHVTRTPVFMRFYIQWGVNHVLSVFLLENSPASEDELWLLFENVILLAVVVIIESLFKLIVYLTKLVGYPRHWVSKLLLIPLFLSLTEAINWDSSNKGALGNTTVDYGKKSMSFGFGLLCYPWKLVSILISVLMNERNVYILIIQLYFMVDYILANENNPWGMAMIVIWLLATTSK